MRLSAPDMHALAMGILSGRSMVDLAERVHAAAREIMPVEQTTLGLISPSGSQIVLEASTDTSVRASQILTVGHVSAVQQMLHDRCRVDMSEHGGVDDMRKLGNAYPRANMLVPAYVEDRLLGVIMWKIRKPGETREHLGEMGIIAQALGSAMERLNAVESLRIDNARWHDNYAELLDELDRLDLYGDLFRYNPDGMLLMNLEGRILLSNPAAESVLCPEGGNLPDRLVEILEETSKGEFRELVEGFKQGIFPHDTALKIGQPSGEVAQVSVSISLVPREPEVILLTLRDVTEERRTQRRLRETTAFMEKIISASVDAIIASDMRGRIVLYNETAARFWGMPVEEALGMHVNELYQGDQAKEIMAKLRSDDYGGPGKMNPQRIWLLSRTGENIPVSLAAYIIYDDDQEAYTIGVFNDLRERIRAEEKIAFIEGKLAQSEKQMELAELAGAMAHELNQPLTSIHGSTEILLKHLETTEKARRYAQIIQGESIRMSEIIKKIGRVTRFETQSYVGSSKITDLEGDGEGD